jgi:hypothetical protein
MVWPMWILRFVASFVGVDQPVGGVLNVCREFRLRLLLWVTAQDRVVFELIRGLPHECCRTGALTQAIMNAEI